MLRHFRNELGNDITIDISEKEIEGTDGILISMVGPDSDTDMHITKVEAQTLYEVLGSVLGWKR